MTQEPIGGEPQPEKKKPEEASKIFSEPVWTYRGYKLRASEFTTAMVHLFRAEVQRANVWRQRLDTTTNWAVVTTGAAISFAFSQSDSTHIVILLNVILVTMFLSIEARRYRYYELWSYRVRLMETDFFASMLVPPFHPSPDWAETLSENLLHPQFPISVWEAVGRRLRLNYLWIYGVIGASWLAQLWLLPQVAASPAEFIRRASIGTLGGAWILTGVMLFYSVILLISIGTIGLHEASGEVLPRFEPFIPGPDKLRSSARAWFRPSRQRAQYLTYIITDRAQAVADRILKEMNRGVTSVTGTGMYTGQAHSVLFCALAVTEVPQLKALVNKEDPKAFVIVTAAQEVYGSGFSSLSEDIH